MTPSFSETTRVFARIGLLSFGGPAAQIALMHKELVDDRPWLTEDQFLSALSFCMLLPGPEAMQLATYAGWRLHGTKGGLMAGALFVLPGAFVVLALSIIYALLGDVPLVVALFLGIKAAVVVIVIQALIKVSQRALKHPVSWAIAAASFVGIFFLALPYPLIVAAAAIVGVGFIPKASVHPAPISQPKSAHPLATIAIWGSLWAIPLLALYLANAKLLTSIGLFFSKLAVVTFGGAYAVLAYMTQEVVVDKGWISTATMMDGLGLAETTPGPLILVTEFVGFQAAFAEGGLWLGIAGAAFALWATFIPCFLWIFTAAPYLSQISSRPRLAAALSGITAAVVGVILNLSIWFALHVLFETAELQHFGPLQILVPDVATLNVHAAILACLAALLMLRFKVGMGATLAVMAVSGLALSFF
ncbi:chromate efflux transporter [Falsihalocynthiibacter sp. SS001]|uniref:chromate efflux transporter n=1 Tax=Falsihalocynthiibacter sp. SS001 TaxID=3349698 RepID=UPI0036D31EDE